MKWRLSFVMGASTARVGEARGKVQEFLRRHRVTPHRSDDAVLAVSELVSNVIQHSPDDQVIPVSVATDGTAVELQVGGAAHLAPDDLRASLPDDPLDVTGRGLAIVDAVSDDVELLEVDGERLVRVQLGRVRCGGTGLASQYT